MLNIASTHNVLLVNQQACSTGMTCKVAFGMLVLQALPIPDGVCANCCYIAFRQLQAHDLWTVDWN